MLDCMLEVKVRLLRVGPPVAGVGNDVGVGVALVVMVTTTQTEGPTPLAGWTSSTADITAQDKHVATTYWMCTLYTTHSTAYLHWGQ